MQTQLIDLESRKSLARSNHMRIQLAPALRKQLDGLEDRDAR